MFIKKIKKGDIYSFVKELMKRYELIAPTKKDDRFVFKVLENVKEMRLDYDTTILPPKKFFYPPVETMWRFQKGEITLHSTIKKKRILFGIHPCDLKGIAILDKIATGDYVDPYYMNKRKNTILVALNCKEPSEYCFCESMDSDKPEGYDILLTDIGEEFFVETGSKVGEDLLKNHNKFFIDANFEEKKEMPKKFAKEIEIKGLQQLLKDKFEADVWNELGEKCLGCGVCSFVCPTCYCYYIQDKLNLDLNSGQRERVWDSCLLVDFARIAGNVNFRDKRSARIKQRIYHKHAYFDEEYGMQGCVGCGRCIRECIVKIDKTDAIKKLRGG